MFQEGTQCDPTWSCLFFVDGNYPKQSFRNKQIKDLSSGVDWKNESLLDTLCQLRKNCFRSNSLKAVSISAQGNCFLPETHENGLGPPGEACRGLFVGGGGI